MGTREEPLGESYGAWIGKTVSRPVPDHSFLHETWTDVSQWSLRAKALFEQYVLAPDIAQPDVEVTASGHFDGLQIEELCWRLPFGPATEAYLLKPEGAGGKLPAVLALHDHGGNTCLGKRKIARVNDSILPQVRRHQDLYYGGRAWANELAKRGYAVLVYDVFPFESRKILPSELPGCAADRVTLPPEQASEPAPGDSRSGRSGTVPADGGEQSTDCMDRYNAFARQLEPTIAKSLFCAGLTWPGLVLAEDRVALRYLQSRSDIDPERIGCGGLSLGGMRTNNLAGSDASVRCSVTAGFMTTWADFAMHTARNHTWMLFIPGLPRHMEYPDILAMRAPSPSLVLCCTEDALFTLEEVRRAEHMLRRTYCKARRAEAFAMSYHDGPHRFDIPMQEQAFAWFDRWL